MNVQDFNKHSMKLVPTLGDSHTKWDRRKRGPLARPPYISMNISAPWWNILKHHAVCAQTGWESRWMFLLAPRN